MEAMSFDDVFKGFTNNANEYLDHVFEAPQMVNFEYSKQSLLNQIQAFKCFLYNSTCNLTNMHGNYFNAI